MILNNKTIFDNNSKYITFDTPEKSFSPFFSSIGITAEDGQKGLGGLVLHYNRFTREIFKKTVDVPFIFDQSLSDITKLVCGSNSLTLAFYDKNSFVIQIKTDDPVSVFAEPSDLTEIWISESGDKNAEIYGYSKTTETRDPDEKVPFTLSVSVTDGILKNQNNCFKIYPENGKIFFAAVFNCLDIDREKNIKILESAPFDVIGAENTTVEWIKRYTRSLSLNIEDDTQTDKIISAIHGLLSNLTFAEGKLKGHISAFPNRGTYPTHFLWDTCFQNLTYEMMDPGLAEDLLLQNIDNQRFDGKYGQFLCSTWERPHDSQPALIGWAGKRLFKINGNKEFALKLYESLKRNNKWWLTQRITDTGLIYTLGGLETGQDNSPRFDNGPTIACDMNAYLLDQLYITAELADFFDKQSDYLYWTDVANDFANRIRSVLYCDEDGFFYDVSLKTREFIRIISPSGILPIWSGNVLPENDSIKMIKNYLLNEKYLFGAVPFPSVAYSEKTYDASEWWRGPTWMPIAYLMLETLEKYGFRSELKTAAERLYNVMAKDDRCSELFDSKTGEGLGSAQQGWTCAIFIKLTDYLFGGKNGLL